MKLLILTHNSYHPHHFDKDEESFAPESCIAEPLQKTLDNEYVWRYKGGQGDVVDSDMLF